ncbi:hypothetical protein LZP73_12960 [Shewanella sp. AS16]|uniref:hypothetical protein n=1 Tax=Shewanella sp. AS16 TaxID=2907625 RepID=UPI001F3A3B81|nr:hypothetical protein [Shewanella sp. AS16]MCE9687101.1 hypothetical protein [Shewanella sp. AS16]
MMIGKHDGVDHSHYMALVLDKASSISPNAGVGWMLCRNGRVLAIRGSMHGERLDALLEDIDVYGEAADLYLSSPPNPLFVDSQVLLDVAIRGQIKQILFPQLDAHLCAPFEPQPLLSPATVDIVPLPSWLLEIRSYLTLQTYMQKHRPWVTCVTSADLCGRESSLETFEHEFGAMDYLRNLFQGAHFIATQPHSMPTSLDKLTNNLGHDLPPYSMSHLHEAKTLLSQGYANKQTSCVLVTSVAFAASLVKEGLVDEIVYHLSLGRGLPNEQPIRLLSDEWEIFSSAQFSNGIRLNARRKGLYVCDNLSKLKLGRLN